MTDDVIKRRIRKMTHTYAVLEVSKQTYREIKEKLITAGYTHVFDDDIIDMNGIGLKEGKPKHEWEFYANGSFCKRCGAGMGSGVECK